MLALATPRQRRIAIWLLIPAVSYYVSFINVILYNYDRFMMPVCFLLAIFGGLAFDRLLRQRLPARAGAAIAVVAFAYTLLYASTVDVLMIRDSRYEAEAWMAAHVTPTDIVGVSGLHEYLPRIDGYHLEDIGTVPELAQEHPKYVVLNADYARAVPVDTEWGKMIAGLEGDALGYHRVARFREASPWPWLPAGAPRSRRSTRRDDRLQHAAKHQPDDRDLRANATVTTESQRHEKERFFLVRLGVFVSLWSR